MRKAIAQHLAGSLNRASRAQEIYESNAIEGKLATLEETFGILNDRHLFDADAAIARYTLHESLTDDPKVQDVVGLAAARILVDQYIQEPDRPLAEADVRDMHGLILAGHHSAGRYKVHLNSIEGSTHVPTPPVDVPGAMNMLVEWFRYSDAPLVWRAAVTHAWFTHIHPFDDGNGRIARLLANYTLGFGSYPPLIVKSSSDRGKYLSALSASDDAGDIVPLMQVFARALDRQLKIMEKPNFGWELFQKDLRIREDSIHKRWSTTLDRFLHEVSAHLRISRIKFEVIGSVGPSDFEFLRGRSSSGNGWIARVSNGDARRDLLVWTGHVTDRMYGRLEKDQVFPALFLSERDPDPKAPKPFRRRVHGLPEFHDEICIIADEDRAMLRRGSNIQRVSLRDASELWAGLLSGYLR
ncbi:Fic family protein [Nocardioides aromaticivorans]|uniref:Fic family protein n=1 Tax=Nocardioides aromaticivorans TaxID=200618 RepID=A0A7Y9ZEX8_9ACTN|nr:Fic family protein [Nocardioides aromaticivorans]NYI42983.1 Fic family protein [Nocardioides aromaticivorans]